MTIKNILLETLLIIFCILIVASCIFAGWFLVWKCFLKRFKFVQELLDNDEEKYRKDHLFQKAFQHNKPIEEVEKELEVTSSQESSLRSSTSKAKVKAPEKSEFCESSTPNKENEIDNQSEVSLSHFSVSSSCDTESESESESTNETSTSEVGEGKYTSTVTSTESRDSDLNKEKNSKSSINFKKPKPVINQVNSSLVYRNTRSKKSIDSFPSEESNPFNTELESSVYLNKQRVVDKKNE